MADTRSFEDRSRSAKKGWATRRQREVERGERTPESYEDIYGHSWEEPIDNWINEEQSSDVNNENNEPQEDDVEDYDSTDESFIEDNTVLHEQLVDDLNKYRGSAPEMTDETIAKLIELYTSDTKEYLQNLKDNDSEIDGCFKEMTKGSDLYEMYIAFGKIIELASGGDITAEEWNTHILQPRRNDMFHMYHEHHPNAKFGIRRSLL